jgi:hypothetical protein
MWVQTVYHELGHYVFWSDAERKAEAFTLRMVRGLRRPARRPGLASHSRRAHRRSPNRRSARIRIRRRTVPQFSSRTHRSRTRRKKCA